MEKKEREIWVGGDRLYFGEDNILYITVVGESDEKKAIEMKKFFLELVNIVEGKVNILVDFNKSGKASPETRKTWKELGEHEKAGKVAHFGMHPVARVIASFVMGTSKKKDMRFFKTKQEALVWLKESGIDK